MFEPFEILAEIAVGIAGFSAVVVAVTRDPTEWKTADAYRTALLLALSVSALFLALLPLGLSIAPLSDAAICRTTSATLVVVLVLGGLWNLRARSRSLDPSLWLGRRAIAVIAGTGAVNGLAQLGNAAATPFAPNASVPFFGIAWQLAYAAFIFTRIVFNRPEAS